MSEVYFFDYSKNQEIYAGIEALFKKSELPRIIKKGDSVAVKVHMGERGNRTYLRPVFVRRIVDLVKEADGKPFVTDTTTLYPKKRFTAKDYLETAAINGFTRASLGVPIVIAGGPEGYDGTVVPIKKAVDGCQLKEIKVASQITKADVLLVVSHAKGHQIAVFGGAVKNMGMGCVTKESKSAQHMVNRPILDLSLCNGCGTCVIVCPFKAITLKDGKPVTDYQKCMACSTCYFNCPQRALSWPKDAREKLQVYVAHAASAVLSLFKKNKIGFVNFVHDITPLCDCCTPAGSPIVKDAGILASKDPVAIDKASLDLIDKSPLITGATTFSPPNLLGKLYGSDSLIQLRTAQKLGLGNMSYTLTTI